MRYTFLRQNSEISLTQTVETYGIVGSKIHDEGGIKIGLG